jgi:hypothetical protein
VDFLNYCSLRETFFQMLVNKPAENPKHDYDNELKEVLLADQD